VAPVADLEADEVGAAALEREVDLLAGDAHGIGVAARVEVDVEVVAQREAHEVAAGEQERRDRLGIAPPPLAIAELRAVDLDQHGVSGALARQHRRGAGRLQIARRDERDHDDQPEQDQPPIHATDFTPDRVLRRR
jgi:hypothetical protein